MDEKRRKFEAQALPHLDTADNLARWLARSPADAEDIVQEAMVHTLASVLPLLAAGAVMRATPAFAGDSLVSVKNFLFSPETLTVPVGTRMIWKRFDAGPHTAFSLDGTFRSPTLERNGRFSVTLEKPGVYRYLRSIHRQMAATSTIK